MPQYSFGVGNLYLTRGDIANPTPRQIGILQEVTVDIKSDTKELFGGQEFPVDVASGRKSISWKAKTGQVLGRALCEFLFDQAPTTGLIHGVSNEAGAVPTTPFKITVDNAATFYEDLGVKFADGGINLERVAASPATGQYSVLNGVYTFAAADVGDIMLISYSYTTISSIPSNRLTVTNQDLGSIPPFSLTLFNRYKGKLIYLRLYANTLESGSLPFKMEDYMMTDLAGKAFANDAGQVLDFSSSN